MKKSTAILVASFGTTHPDALEKCIAATERAIAEAFPDNRIYRAFTSGMVIRSLKRNNGITVDGVPPALERIRSDGFARAAVQPTLVMGGIEYELLCRLCENAPLETAVGRPLADSAADARTLADIIMAENPLAPDEALVLMGHGTEHSANRIYAEMQALFEKASYRACVGTVESTPTFADAVDALKKSGAASAKLLPLMFVAGDHAKKDMAGEGGGSLLSLIKAAGINARPILRGLGESPAVRQEYVRRAAEALGRLEK